MDKSRKIRSLHSGHKLHMVDGKWRTTINPLIHCVLCYYVVLLYDVIYHGINYTYSG